MSVCKEALRELLRDSEARFGTDAGNIAWLEVAVFLKEFPESPARPERTIDGTVKVLHKIPLTEKEKKAHAREWFRKMYGFDAQHP